ncbi:MAG: glycerol kinase GlpK [Erysipelotrichaceae bacterium]|nr:glycerol kinase GlpK [Erysipelotrichaceae bacterium]
MEKKYVLALDQGTTSSRAIVFNKQGEIMGSVQQEFPQIYPHTGWVEHDPIEILGSQVGVISEALIRAKTTAKEIAAIGITNQRETTIIWDRKTGAPVYNAIVWQCRRTAPYCDELKEKGYADMIYDKTGLVLDAYFSATKIKWILDNVEGVRERAEKGELAFGTIDTYLIWHLTKDHVHATDYTNASRTMLFNIHTLKWDEELLELMNIPRSLLPEVYPSSHLYGYSDETILGASIPICGVVGDQQAALFGQLCVNKGDIKNTYGTGCFMLMNTGDEAIKSKHGLVTTLAASLDDHPSYVLEGSVFVGGAIVQWLRDEMRMIKNAAETEKYATSVESSNGVYIVPAFVGLGAPHWDPQVRGTVSGLTRGTKKEHFIRASLEAIAYQVYDIYTAMENDLGIKVKTLNVDGGASQNNFLLQFEADVLLADVVRPKVVEVTALGACYLAGLKVGYWKDIEDIRNNKVIERVFTPSMDLDKRERRIKGWKIAVAKARYKPEI